MLDNYKNMTLNFSTENAVIVHFPRFAGGKFISNCLALSRHACPQEEHIAEYLLDHPLDYEYRYQSVLKTLPPSQREMVWWIPKYEYGDKQLYGPVHEKWLTTGQQTRDCINQTTIKLSNSHLHFFIVSHGHPCNLLKVWTHARVIVLINHKKFSKISFNLKSSGIPRDNLGNYCEKKYCALRGPDWPSWKDFESALFDTRNFNCSTHIKNEIHEFYPRYNSTKGTIGFNIDDCIFDKHLFLNSMSKLYEELGFDDFDASLVGNFWQAYMRLHQ